MLNSLRFQRMVFVIIGQNLLFSVISKNYLIKEVYSDGGIPVYFLKNLLK